MKIQKISYIKNLGNFLDFKGNSISDFEEYNFFYGWNYSGKTTFSRLFRFIEIKTIPDDFKDLEFKIETDSEVITQDDIGKEYPIRVFNEDFILENFRWEDENHEINPVFILGKEVKELEEEMKKISEENKNISKQIENLEKDKEKKQKSLENSLTDKASEIRRTLGITNQREFDKNSLDERIKALEIDYESKILDEDNLQKTIEKYKSEETKEINFTPPELILTELLDKVREILSRKVTSQQIIQKLQQNPELSKWVYDGIKFHINETTCQFCGNKLPEDLLDKLNKHFSEGYSKLKKDIQIIGNKINSEIKAIEKISLPSKADFFKDFYDEYDAIKRDFDLAKEVYINNLEKLKAELSKKEARPFEQLEILENIKDSKLDEIFIKFKEMVKKHNAQVKNFHNEKARLKERIIEHYSAEFIRHKNYFEAKKEIESLESQIKDLKKNNEEKQKRINEIQKEIKAETIGAEKINQYLYKFFPDNKLKIILTENGKYKLYRDNKVAKYLSTGEKNTIALIYFFAKLDETKFDFENSIIFIDDPVSSLDSNHLYGMYGFICEKFKNCGQLFITTHNYDFFNLLKDFKRYDLNSDEYKRANRRPKGNLYLITKTKCVSLIQNLPSALEKHKSEYNYLFSILKKFKESSDKSNFDMLFVLPNILRRFLEQYLNMRYPDGKTRSKDIKYKLKQFATGGDQAKITKILKLIDEHSHEEILEHSKRIPDLYELEDCISFVWELLSTNDSLHLKALEESLG